MSDFWLFLGIIGVLYGIGIFWRSRMAVNDPEKYQRLRDFENQRKEDRNEALRKAAPIAKSGADYLIKLLTKK